MAPRHSNGARCTTKTAVAYYRMSSDRQETSIADQRQAVERYAAANGYKIVREYIDEGISGDATEKRKQFQQMIADASRGGFDSILVWDLSRLGRFDALEGGFWLKPLRDAGVVVVTLDRGVIDWTDFGGRLLWSVEQEGKHAYLRDLARNTQRGRANAAASGKLMQKAPYGYQAADGTLQPGVNSETVRRVFRDYIGGKSLRAIAADLNAEGVPSATGKRWAGSGLHYILTNEAYTGVLRWNVRSQGKYTSIRGGDVVTETNGRLHDRDDWITHEQSHPAIIDAETFQQVQQRITSRKSKTTPHRNGGEFLLTSLCRCGKCGGRMSGKRQTSGVQFICNTNTHKSTCDANRAWQDEVVDHIIDAIERKLRQPENRERLRDELRKQVEQRKSKQDASGLRRQLAKVEGKLQKASRRLVEVDPDLLDVVQQQIRELRAERTELQESLKDAEKPTGTLIAEQDRIVEQALSHVSRLRQAIRRADPAKVRELLSSAVDEVRLWSSKRKVGRRHLWQLDRGEITLASNLSRSCG